jgi:enoyl-CoA hydratase
MNYKNIKIDSVDSVFTVTINKPESLNALSKSVLSELDLAFDELDKNPSVRAVVITGAGEKAFVAGADIKEINELTTETAQQFAKMGQKVFLKIEKFKTPVIAAVNGFALGGGFELALSCDFIYANENAKFGLPEVTLGLIPGFGGTVRLSKVAGISCAREIIYSGEMLTATEALQKNIVNKVFSQADLLPACAKIAQTIAKRAPLAVSAAKKSNLLNWDLDLETAMINEAKIFSELFNSTDVREGTKAFIEKRKAQFTGK